MNLLKKVQMSRRQIASLPYFRRYTVRTHDYERLVTKEQKIHVKNKMSKDRVIDECAP